MNKRCSECGGEIEFHFITPAVIFKVNDDLSFTRIDEGDAPHLEAVCSVNNDHSICDVEDLEFQNWIVEVSTKFGDLDMI